MITEGKKVTGYWGGEFPLSKGVITSMYGPVVEVEWTRGFFIGTIKHQNQDVYDAPLPTSEHPVGPWIGIFIDKEENPTND